MANKSSGAQPAVRDAGWLVTASATGALLALGVLYAWSVVKKEIPDTWGWNASQKTLPYSVAIVIFSVMTAVGGRLQDRFGPRVVVSAGGVFAGVGVILSSMTTSPWVFTLTFGVLLGTGIGFVYSSGTPTAVKWFPAKRTGLISGIVVAGFGMGAAWVAPLARNLIASHGVQTTLLWLGIGMLIAIVGFAQFLKVPPAGYIPPGSAPAGSTAAAPVRDYTPSGIARTWQFYVLWFAFAFGSGAGLMIIGNLASIVDTQAKQASVAALAVTALALGNGAGRVVAGALSDRFGRLIVLEVSFVFQAALVLLMGQAKGGSFLATVVSMMALSALIGANYGAILAVVPAICKDYYGLKNFGSNYGLVYTAWGLGGFMISLGAGMINDSTGTFKYAYYMAAALLAVAVVLLVILRAPAHSSESLIEELGSPAAVPASAK